MSALSLFTVPTSQTSNTSNITVSLDLSKSHRWPILISKQWVVTERWGVWPLDLSSRSMSTSSWSSRRSSYWVLLCLRSVSRRTEAWDSTHWTDSMSEVNTTLLLRNYTHTHTTRVNRKPADGEEGSLSESWESYIEQTLLEVQQFVFGSLIVFVVRAELIHVQHVDQRRLLQTNTETCIK